ncbi:unnamed protein product [Chrysodeixis includens]|uniref:Uncharacterized protein n=1 Tax=Chrysodeixis includens TaxID=689277 RepID=A0A9N8L337_CHRIL|nr:unnamed protein product [Chrysodeixis includens]
MVAGKQPTIAFPKRAAAVQQRPASMARSRLWMWSPSGARRRRRAVHVRHAGGGARRVRGRRQPSRATPVFRALSFRPHACRRQLVGWSLEACQCLVERCVVVCGAVGAVRAQHAEQAARRAARLGRGERRGAYGAAGVAGAGGAAAGAGAACPPAPAGCVCAEGGARLTCRSAALRRLPPLHDNLLSLDVSNNNISTLPRGALLPAAGLRELNLSSNRLESVSEGALGGAALARLWLDRCGLPRLPARALQDLHHLHFLGGVRAQPVSAESGASARAACSGARRTSRFSPASMTPASSDLERASCMLMLPYLSTTT